LVPDAVDARVLTYQRAPSKPLPDLLVADTGPQQLSAGHPAVRATRHPRQLPFNRPILLWHCNSKLGGIRYSPPAGGAYALDSSRPTRAAYRERTRRSRASGDGHPATSAPSTAIAPPIQIQTTSGETIARKLAGGGSER
jgi:hypothetical protein